MAPQFPKTNEVDTHLQSHHSSFRSGRSLSQNPFHRTEPALIMIIDDVADNLDVLSTMIMSANYRVAAFPCGEMALAAAEQEPPDLILLDILMPKMDGFEMCKCLKENYRLAEIPVLFISALQNTQDKVRAFQAGGVDYVNKPFHYEEVLARVATHLQLRNLQQKLEEHNQRLGLLVQEQVRELEEAQMATIHALSDLLESRDQATGLHIKRMDAYCLALGEQMIRSGDYYGRLDRVLLKNLRQASALHDIGKVAIPDVILNKPGKLTAEEMKIMRTHAALGADTLQRVLTRHPNNPFLRVGVQIARHHHERWDGTGYPDGLEAENIPLVARMMSIADVYDALRSRRPYKEPFTHEHSVRVMEDMSGGAFDPSLMKNFLACQYQFDAIWAEFGDEEDKAF